MLNILSMKKNYIQVNPIILNYPYAYAKRLLEIQSRVYREQYNDNFICLIPTNIYGPNDNYNLENSHVIPGLDP